MDRENEAGMDRFSPAVAADQIAKTQRGCSLTTSPPLFMSNQLFYFVMSVLF